jgi:short chain dehydrogenase
MYVFWPRIEEQAGIIMGCCCCLSYVAIAIVLFLVYKLIDFARRKLLIGRYADRYIVLTGCDSGFGQSAARRLDNLGCHVFAGCLTEAGQKELNANCSGRLKTFELDVSKHDSVLRAYEFVASKLPEGKGT